MVMALAADFDDAVLGRGLPEAAARALEEAGRWRADDPARALLALSHAEACAPGHPAVLIGLYRHHFYAHQWRAARDVARRALAAGGVALGLPSLWHQAPDAPLPGARDDVRARFYLFALKGYAYLSLRIGDGSEAAQALAKLRALDPEDFVGGALVEAVRRRALAGADDDDVAVAPVFGRAAWQRAAELPA
jgi:hypothetical protein